MLDAVSSAGDCARGVGARAVTIGILPTLGAEHLASDQLTEDPRYALLNRQMLTARGEPFRLDITEPPAPRGGAVGGAPAEHLVLDVDSIAPEAACTSLQLHLQLTPEAFPAYWNAAQASPGLQVALAANSPFLLGRRLWAETRVPLFTQAVDTRPGGAAQPGRAPAGVVRRPVGAARPTTCSRRTSATSARCCPWPRTRTRSPSSTRAARRACTSCACTTARCGAGTARCTTSPTASPHLRLENRVLPAGPTAVDAVANAMFFYGLIRALAESERPPWQLMSFDAAEANFTAGARHGHRRRRCTGPGIGTVRADELALRRMLPLAQEGLAAWGVDGAAADRYLSVIEQRCVRRCTGADVAGPHRGRGRAPRRRPPDARSAG